MDLYKRIRKLQIIDPQFDGKVIASPGPFHVVLCALRCLGATIENSGLDEAWVHADIYGSLTATQILNGKHHNRALDAHQITVQVLFDLWIDSLFIRYPDLKDTMKTRIEKLLKACEGRKDVDNAYQDILIMLKEIPLQERMEEYDEENKDNPLYQFLRIYMKQVLNLLQFIRATRDGNWLMYLAALEEMCTYFFAYNRHDYAQHIPEYIAQMYSLKTSHPQIWNEFERGEFVVKRNPVPFTSVGHDQAQEHMNRVHKGDGALPGIMTSPDAILKYCLSAPELSRMVGEINEMHHVDHSATEKHHRDFERNVNYQEDAISKLKSVLKECKVFESTQSSQRSDDRLFNVMTKVIMPTEVQEDILAVEERGKREYEKFTHERIIGDGNLWDKLKKVKFLNWSDGSKVVKTKNCAQEVSLKSTNALFVRLLLIAKSSRHIRLEEIIGNYELSSVSASLMNADGTLQICTDKSKLTTALECLTTTSTSQDAAATAATFMPKAILFDGMAVVNEAHAVKEKILNCKDLATILIQLIRSKSRSYDESYILFDDYEVESMKDVVRDFRTGDKSKKTGYKVEDNTRISNLKDFLATKQTKQRLVEYLGDKFANAIRSVTVHTPKEVRSSGGHMVQIESSHLEADTLLMLYGSHLHKQGRIVTIYSSDVDVLVLAIRRSPLLGQDACMVMGTGDRRRVVNLKSIHDSIGPLRAAALPAFHALTGCDLTSRIKWKSKSSCLKVLMSANDDLVEGISHLGEGSMPPVEVAKNCEKFICHLYDSSIHKADELRWRMFKKQPQSIEKLPPTPGAIYQHILRAHYVSSIWLQDIVPHPKLDDPATLGWQKHDGKYYPVISQNAMAPDDLLELVRCQCKASECRGRRCSCRSHDLPCTELCGCDEIGCSNRSSRVETDDEEDDCS